MVYADTPCDGAMRLRILLVTDRPERAALIEQALLKERHDVVAWIRSDDDLVQYARQARPDVLLVELEAPTSALQAQLERVMQEQPLPVAVFADRSDSGPVRTAVKAGVSAFVVDGFRPSRVLPVLEAACARFLEFQSLRRERDSAVSQLAERKTVERAKGILMRRRNLQEGAAYRVLRKMAMDRGKRLFEVAESIVTAEEILAEV